MEGVDGVSNSSISSISYSAQDKPITSSDTEELNTDQIKTLATEVFNDQIGQHVVDLKPIQQELERLGQCVAQSNRKIHSHNERLAELENSDKYVTMVNKLIDEQIKEFKVLFLSEFKYWRQKN